MTAIGAALPRVPHRELVAHGRALDALGFDELWLVEDCFLYGGVSSAAAILASTERIGVGVGLFPVAVRNPAILAMELATIAELYPGRMTAGVGHGVESVDAPDRRAAGEPAGGAAGAADRGPAAAGGRDASRSTDGGRISTTSCSTSRPAVPPPLVVGTTGERGIAIAAEHADGLLLPEGSGVAAVRWARELLGPERRLVVYSWMRIEDSSAQALAALTPWIEQLGAGRKLPAAAGAGARPSPAPTARWRRSCRWPARRRRARPGCGGSSRRALTRSWSAPSATTRWRSCSGSRPRCCRCCES